MNLIGKKTRKILERIAVALETIARGNLYISGGVFLIPALGDQAMFVVQNDHQDEPFTISSVSATDAEGETVTLTEEAVSDNPDVVSFVFDEGFDASNPRSGKLHFGHSGLANLNYTAKDPSGNIVKSTGKQFTLTTGNVATVTGGDFEVPGLTES